MKSILTTGILSFLTDEHVCFESFDSHSGSAHLANTYRHSLPAYKRRGEVDFAVKVELWSQTSVMLLVSWTTLLFCAS